MRHRSLSRLAANIWTYIQFGLAAVLILSACALSAAAVSAQTPASANGSNMQLANTPKPDASLPANYTLGSGDHVRITVFGQDDMNGEYSVDGSGELAFPLIGRIQAGGLTANELSHTLEAKLSPDYIKNPHVSVEVLTYRPFYIVGEVKTPGSYPYVSGMTVLNAIALAGGYTYRARDDSFYVTRNVPGGAQTKLSAQSNTSILPGDIITVRERYF